MNIEALFEAEARLRIAARAYAGVESTPQSIECRRTHARELRLAARAYADLAGRFEGGVPAEVETP